TYRFTLSSEAPGSHNVPLSQAKKVCEGFRPLDSQLVRTKRQPRTAGLPDGIQYIYVSKVFAQVVNDDNEFRDTETTETGPDGALPTTAPGTFTLFYLGNDSTGYGLCFLTVGINWPAG
ncbi:MAG: hypothetical protein J2P37_35485, partial [Ktedonobacteraceae bacterium]|nr:hypothetical protein [Ktedonobacteraceae bacterium]